MQFILNKKTFVVPSVPSNIEDVGAVRNVLFNFAKLFTSIIQSLTQMEDSYSDLISVRVATMEGDETFTYESMISRVFLNPDGATLLYEPSGEFEEGASIELINTGDISDGIVFDPYGISMTVFGGSIGWFYTDGVSWFGALSSTVLNNNRLLPELTVPVPALDPPVTSIIHETPVTQDGMDDLTVPVPTLEAPVTRNFNYLGICTVTCPAEVTVVTLEAHGLSDNDCVKFIPASGVIANEIANDYEYYADVIDVDTFNLVVVPSGEIMDTTGTQTAVDIKLYKLV